VSKVDLHIHTTASDGRLSPADIVRKSVELGLAVIAIADHDTVDGIEPALAAAKAFPELRVIPCVEMSTDIPQEEVHVLGYFVDYTAPDFRAGLEKLRRSRWERARGIVARLASLGINIDWQRVQEIAGDGAMGRPHIAQAMLEKGYISSLKEAFVSYIGRNGPAYVEREKLTPVEAVGAILQAKGLPVLAHPLTASSFEKIIADLKAAGLVGIEAYYNGYTGDEVAKLVGLAERHGLIATGGSDFHGLDTGTETMIGGVDVPLESAGQLISLAQQRGLKLAGS